MDGADSGLDIPLAIFDALIFGLTGATFDIKLNLDALAGLLDGSPNNGAVSGVFGFDVYDAYLTESKRTTNMHFNFGFDFRGVRSFVLVVYLSRGLVMTWLGEFSGTLVGLRNSLIGGKRFCSSLRRPLLE